MSKFKVNERVISVDGGKIGVIKARETLHEGKTTTVKYMVSFGDGMENWKILDKSQISKIHNQKKEEYYTKVIKLKDGKVLTFVSRVVPIQMNMEVPYYDEDYETEEPEFTTVKKKGRVLNIGFSIYNGNDDYNEKIGYKYAKARCKKKPYVSMMSSFGGEFNQITVDKIIEAKAQYIEEHLSDMKFK
jgi:hypothetical protein